jgi:hypothetical protein
MAAVMTCGSLSGCLTTDNPSGTEKELNGANEAEAQPGTLAPMPAVDGAASYYEESAEDPATPVRRQSILQCGEPGSWDACSATCRCDDGVGDCDDDSECVEGARCMRDVGGAYGWDSGMDVCEVGCVPPDPGYLGTIDFCSTDCPCASRQGDCDSQAECEEGLRCMTDIGAEVGFEEDVDVCLYPYDELMNGTYDHCSVDFPCASGHGDCDSDDECLPELRCGRNLGEEFFDDPEIDVCLSPYDDRMNGTADHCSVDFLCDWGHGDCDSHSECLPELRCGFDLGLEFGFDDAEIDVCLYPYDDLMNGTDVHCSTEFPCASGHGDCDSDADCLPELRCGFDLGLEFEFDDAELDICLSPYDDLMNGTNDHCSTDHPCAAEHGDCDGDDECQSGNTCVYNVGDDYGWAETIDVCLPAA